MKQEKKEIILDEIEHWRDSRLLPEHYCDFLSNLYQEPQSKRTYFFSLTSLKHADLKLWFLTFGIFSLICFIGFYFSSFPLPLQMLSSLILVGVCYTYAGIFKRRSRLLSLVFAGAGCLLMLVLGVWMIALHSLNEGLWTTVLVASCGAVWIFLGYIFKMGILHYCGVGCWLLLYAVFCVEFLPNISWVQLQLLWLPLAILFISLSWLLHRRHKVLSQVYFSVGLTIWMLPEMDITLLRHQTPTDFVFLCILKVAITLGVLFFSRKKWIVWVST
jgi:hypothetical protein